MKRIWLLAIACWLSAAAYAGTYQVTAYCHCAKCNGVAGQPTASGKQPIAGITVAGPRRIPIGTRVYIAGVGERIVQDRLAKRFDDRFDIFMETHDQAKSFGLKTLNITILK